MGKKLDTAYKNIHFVNHSHIDFTWWNSPEICGKRNEEIINSILELCGANPDFKFSYESTAGLMSYLEKRPEKKDELCALLDSERLDVGGLFVSAHSDALTDEAVARNFYFGKLWLERELGYSPTICKEYDVPGHTLQMPQLVKSAGMDTLIITRGPRGGFYWAAPDGSEILTLCIPYNWSYWRKLGIDFDETEKNLPDEIKRAAESYPGAELVIPDGDDMTLPNESLLEIVEHWNAAYDRPKLALSTMPEAIAKMRVKKSTRRSGDMPNLWVVMNLLQVETGQAVRKIQDLLPIAEALCAIRCIERTSYKTYPAKVIDSCWMRSLLVADHNWGCKDKDRGGPAGDEHKAAIADKALRDSQKLVEGAVEGISYALAEEENDEALTVFVHNPVGWNRTDVVSVEVECSFPGLEAIEIVNSDNEVVPFEVDILERHEEDNTISRARADFLGRDLPSLGYATYYVKPIMEKMEVEAESPAESPKEGTAIENEFYRVEFAEDGSHIKSLYDKELDMELAGTFNTAAGPLEFDFGTFELFGIGMRLSVPDESFFENPENEGTGESVDFTGEILRAADYPAEVRIEKSGGFSQTLVAEGDFAGSKRMQKVVLYEGIKRVDLHVEIDWDGRPDTVLYLEMPNTLMNGQTHVDVPFAVHRDGNELTEFWIDEAMPIQFKTRGVQDWICFEEGGRGLAVATRWPVADFTLTPAFPLLWTNASSGFFFGDRYKQAKKHAYQFSLTSYEGAWHENDIHLWGKQWSSPTLTFFGNEAPVEKRRSYMSIDSPNIVISALKKAHDEEAVVVRLYEVTGKKTTAQLQTTFTIKSARTTNLIETASSNLASKENTVKLSFRPYEIKTIKLYI